MHNLQSVYLSCIPLGYALSGNAGFLESRLYPSAPSNWTATEKQTFIRLYCHIIITHQSAGALNFTRGHVPAWQGQTELNSLESLTGRVKSHKPILLIMFTVKFLTFKQPGWYLNFCECLWKTWLFGQKNIRLQNERHFVENNTVIMQHVSKMQ